MPTRPTRSLLEPNISDNELVSSGSEDDDYDDSDIGNGPDQYVESSSSEEDSDDNGIPLAALYTHAVIFDWSSDPSKSKEREAPVRAKDITKRSLRLNETIDPEGSLTIYIYNISYKRFL